MTTETTIDLFSLAGAALNALGTQYAAALQRTNTELGLEGQAWNLLFAVQGVEPAPITAALLKQFVPYITLEKLEQQLADAAGRGLLQADATGSYRLTDHGRTAVQQSFGAVHAALADMQPLPADNMKRLNQLLRRLVDATLTAPAPIEKRQLHASRLTDPGARGAILPNGRAAAALTDQYLTDLVRFRDDAHQAAWQPYGVGGPTWEALTLIWRGAAYSPDSLAKLLDRRAQLPQGILSIITGRVGLVRSDSVTRSQSYYLYADA